MFMEAQHFTNAGGNSQLGVTGGYGSRGMQQVWAGD